MDTRTGEIKYFDEGAPVPEHFIEIVKESMTEKQAKSKQVSKHDNRSILGKKFKEERAKRKKFPTARAKRKWMTKQIKKQSQP